MEFARIRLLDLKNRDKRRQLEENFYQPWNGPICIDITAIGIIWDTLLAGTKMSVERNLINFISKILDFEVDFTVDEEGSDNIEGYVTALADLKRVNEHANLIIISTDNSNTFHCLRDIFKKKFNFQYPWSLSTNSQSPVNLILSYQRNDLEED